MTNVGGVKGEGEIPEPTGPKRKKKVDSEAFKEIMKVGKAREVDPEEKRKRKRREEAEEEAQAKLTKPPSQGIPSAEETIPVSFEPTIRGGREAPSEEAAEERKDAQAPPPFTPPETTPPSFPQAPEEVGEISPPSAPTKKKEKKKPAAARLESSIKEAKKKKPKEKTPPLKAEKKGPVEKPPIHEEGKEAFFTTFAKHEEKKPEEKKEKEPVAEEIAPLPLGAWEATKALEEGKEGGKIEKEAPPPSSMEMGPGMPSLDISIPPPPPAELGATSFVNLPQQILHIFERMVGVMSVMTSSGITETTIHLDAPQFKNSMFFGAEIIITEFSTAPKAFNIELVGNSEAINLFNGNIEELVAAFQAGNYNFKVHRIDTSLSAAARLERQKVGKVKRKQGKKS